LSTVDCRLSTSSDVVDLDHRQLALARVPEHRHRVAHLLAQERLADRRLPGDGAARALDLVDPDDAVDVAGALLVVDGDGGAEEDAVAAGLGPGIDHRHVVEALAEE